MKIEIPHSLILEHEELHAELVEATKAGGATGEAAKGVAKVLHSHFLKEEEYAMPPLGLLSVLSFLRCLKNTQRSLQPSRSSQRLQ